MKLFILGQASVTGREEEVVLVVLVVLVVVWGG